MRRLAAFFPLVLICVAALQTRAGSQHGEGPSADLTPLIPPGLILGLRHNLHHEKSELAYGAMLSASEAQPVERMWGGDVGAPPQRGFEWWSVKSNPVWTGNSGASFPPGLVFSLRHTRTQSDSGSRVWRTPLRPIFGIEALESPASLATPQGSLERQFGGDLDAAPGEGFTWYESTGDSFSDSETIDRLPKWTVIGLKHSRNQPGKRLEWRGEFFDPADPERDPPEGFRRMFGGDQGGRPGEGFYWYEKEGGPELVAAPQLRAKLPRSMVMGEGDSAVDLDRDGLVDELENRLAETFRPYLIFDDTETSRESFEPVTLFQVRSLTSGRYSKDKVLAWAAAEDDGEGSLLVGLRWVFLFGRDSGYGKRSDWHCVGRKAHSGDNDDALFVLQSSDEGQTWRLILVALSSRGVDRDHGYPTFPSTHPVWPLTSRLEVHDLNHPIIYISAGKHHQHLTRDLDGRDSPYGAVRFLDDCDDDVNGLGERFLVDIRALAQTGYNNVGERDHPLTHNLDKFYEGQSAWGTTPFFEVGPNGAKWLP